MSVENGQNNPENTSTDIYDRDRDLRLRAVDISPEKKYIFRTRVELHGKITVVDFDTKVLDKTSIPNTELFKLDYRLIESPDIPRMKPSPQSEYLTEDGRVLLNDVTSWAPKPISELLEVGYFLAHVSSRDIDNAIATMLGEVLVAA